MEKSKGKKILSIALMSFIAFVLVACGTNGDTTDDAENNGTEEATNGEKTELEFWSFWGEAQEERP